MKRDLYNQALFNDSEEVRQGAGKNIIPPPEKEPLWKAYLEKFKDPIIIVLLVVFFLSVCVSVYELIFQGRTIEVLFEPIGVLVALLLFGVSRSCFGGRHWQPMPLNSRNL